MHKFDNYEVGCIIVYVKANIEIPFSAFARSRNSRIWYTRFLADFGDVMMKVNTYWFASVWCGVMNVNPTNVQRCIINKFRNMSHIVTHYDLCDQRQKILDKINNINNIKLLVFWEIDVYYWNSFLICSFEGKKSISVVYRWLINLDWHYTLDK